MPCVCQSRLYLQTTKAHSPAQAVLQNRPIFLRCLSGSFKNSTMQTEDFKRAHFALLTERRLSTLHMFFKVYNRLSCDVPYNLHKGLLLTVFKQTMTSFLVETPCSKRSPVLPSCRPAAHQIIIFLRCIQHFLELRQVPYPLNTVHRAGPILLLFLRLQFLHKDKPGNQADWRSCRQSS
jgi:hypothetical protein